MGIEGRVQTAALFFCIIIYAWKMMPRCRRMTGYMGTPDLSAMESAYRLAMLGVERLGLMTIWCDHCTRAHYATLKTNDICARLMGEIEEAKRCRNSF